MSMIGNSVLLNDTDTLLNEINVLKKQLRQEKQQRKHWEELAMIFHDALWKELKASHKVAVK